MGYRLSASNKVGLTDVATYGAITATSTATMIQDRFEHRVAFTFVNNGAKTVYVGTDSSVTASNGLPIVPGASFTEDYYIGQLWVVCAAAETTDLRYWIVA